MSILDIRNPISESRRKFLNQVNASEDSWIAPNEWDRNAADTQLEPGDKITLGFDGSKSSDHTVLAACRVSDGAVFLLRSWDPEKMPDGEVPRDQVDAVVRSAFERYDVVAFRADVHEFEAYVDEWGKDFKRKLKISSSPNNPVAFDMRGKKKQFALDTERFLDAVLEGELVHNGDRLLRWYILNCHRHPTNYDAVTVRKESKDSSRKIDGAVSAILAYSARQDYMLSKKYRKGRGGAIA
jgi:phage terminase large subunit-like protein